MLHEPSKEQTLRRHQSFMSPAKALIRPALHFLASTSKQSMPDMGIQDMHIAAEGTADLAAKFTFDLQWFAAASPDVAASAQ